MVGDPFLLFYPFFVKSWLLLLLLLLLPLFLLLLLHLLVLLLLLLLLLLPLLLHPLVLLLLLLLLLLFLLLLLLLLSPVEVGDGDYLAADVIVEPVDAVGVDEAVADPQARLDALLHLAEQLQGRLKTPPKNKPTSFWCSIRLMQLHFGGPLNRFVFWSNRSLSW